MRLSELLIDAAKNAGYSTAGTTLGGACAVFVLGFNPMGHGPNQSLTLEAALAGALFGLLGGTVYVAPFAAILGGVLSRFVSRRAASISAVVVGASLLSLAIVATAACYFEWFGLSK